MFHIPSSKELIVTLSGLSPFGAYSLILGVLFLCGFGLPVPEDVTLLVAGLLAGTQRISIGGALIAGFLGVMMGDSILFFLGKHFGKRLFRLPGFRIAFSAERVALAERKVREHQRIICFVGRFVPGLRACIFATAGTMGVNPRIFFIQDGIAALVSVPVWVSLGYYTGENWDLAIKRAHEAQWVLLSLIAVFVVGTVVWRQIFIKKV